MTGTAQLSNSRRWLIAVTVMMVTIIELLDMTIVVVAMRDMMGSLSATREEITWVVTAYIVSAAIVILLTGFLTTRFGRRRVLLIAVIGFLISSALCGASSSLSLIILFRVFQGMFGAVFIPTSQLILKSVFSEKEQGTAMAIWAIGLMTAPVLGPTIGGYITDHLSWRWCFYINVPFCIIAFFMILKFIEETPRIKKTVDWLGICLIIVGIGSLQMFLDQGNTYDWFQSHNITALALTAIGCLSYLIYHCLTTQNPILNLQLFRHSNFTVCTLMMGAYVSSVLSSITLQPIFMEQLLNYPAETTGILLAPRGIASACCMLVVGRFMKAIDPRWFVAIGICLSGIGTYLMTNYNLQMGENYILFTSFIQGCGMGFAIVPLATLCTKGLPKQDLAQSTALFSFSRSLGNAIGVSVLATIITRQTQASWNQLGGQLIATQPSVQHWFQAQHQTLNNPQALQELAGVVYAQASNLAFVDMFWFASLILIVLLPFVFFLKTEPSILEKGLPLD